MKPRPVTDWDLQVWHGKRITYGPPRDGSVDATPLELVKCLDPAVLRIPWVTDGRDTPQFEGTLWLTIWGHQLPPLDGFMFRPGSENAPHASEALADDGLPAEPEFSDGNPEDFA